MFKLFILSLLACSAAFSQYYKTLPKGVRTFVYRNVATNDVNSSYNQTNKNSPYTFEIAADFETLTNIDNPFVQDILAQLSPYPEAAALLTLGTYKASANANIKVDVYGFGYGITDKLTAYAGLPVYDASIKLNYQRNKGNTYDLIAEALQETPNDNIAQTYGAVLDSLGEGFDFDASVLQGIATNQLGYEPVGDWEGHGLGDMELGLMYNVLTQRKYGLLLSGGVIAPTGRVDDPDILQDIGFGDGQWDLFTEFGGSYHLNNKVILTSYLRYTYQFASDKRLRRPTSRDLKYSAESNTYTEKLGNKALFHVSSEYFYNDWLSLVSAYEYENTGEAQYSSDNSVEDGYLGYATDSSTHNVRLSARISTVALFQKKEFLLPASVELKAQRMISGKNTPDVDRYELEFRMFF